MFQQATEQQPPQQQQLFVAVEPSFRVTLSLCSCCCFCWFSHKPKHKHKQKHTIPTKRWMCALAWIGRERNNVRARANDHAANWNGSCYRCSQCIGVKRFVHLYLYHGKCFFDAELLFSCDPSKGFHSENLLYRIQWAFFLSKLSIWYIWMRLDNERCSYFQVFIKLYG